jgi:hypothetical protein
MAWSRRLRSKFGAEAQRARSLSAMAAAACLLVGCQADITGASELPGASTSGAPGSGGQTEAPEPGDWFGAVQRADCKAPGQLARSRIRRLSSVQWKNTVAQALGIPAPSQDLPQDAISSATGFNTDANLNKVNVLLANAYFDASDALSASAVTAALQAYPCLGTSAADAACSLPFIKAVGARLFRRPLTDSEASRYAALLTAQAALDPGLTAVATVVRALLLSPNTVYLTELGDSKAGEVVLTAYEQAALISYSVADVPPDSALWQAAEKGMLNDATERRSHAQRLLQTAGARAKYADFWQQYLPLGDLRKATELDPALSAAIADETQQHFDKIVWEKNGSFADLLTASYTYGQASLSAIYGTLTPNGSGALSLPAGQRSGFLTQSGFLFADADSSVPHKVIHRGLTVRRRLLCQSPPPPPANLMPQAADLNPLGADATPLEAYTAFAAQKPQCAACHSAFQPIGLAFEQFDSLGRYRTSYDGGKPIDTAGVLEDAGDASGPYADAVEIGQHIGQSKIGEYCFSRQYAEFSLGRRLNASTDACVIRAASDARPGPPIQELALVLSDLQARTHRAHH